MTQINSQYQSRSVLESTMTRQQTMGTKKNASGALAATVANDLKNITTERKTFNSLNKGNTKPLGDIWQTNGVITSRVGTMRLKKDTHLLASGGLSPSGKNLVINEYIRQHPNFEKHYDANTLAIRYNKDLNASVGSFYFRCEKKQDVNDSSVRQYIMMPIDASNLDSGEKKGLDTFLARQLGVSDDIIKGFEADKQKMRNELASAKSDFKQKLNEAEGNTQRAQRDRDAQFNNNIELRSKADKLQGRVISLEENIKLRDEALSAFSAAADADAEKLNASLNAATQAKQSTEAANTILAGEKEKILTSAKAIADGGKRSYGWAVAIAAVTAAITATVAAVGGILTHNGENKLEEANEDITSAEDSQSTAATAVSENGTGVEKAQNADYDADGVKAGDLAAQKQIDADMAEYLVAQGNGDTDKMKEIAGHYTVLPDGGTPDFSLPGLTQEGKDYIQPYYTDGYNKGVNEARDTAVTNATELLTESKETKKTADQALSNAQASKKSAEKMKAGGIATLAAGLPVVLMGGGLMAAANGYHVKKKNQVINANLRNIKEGNYDKTQSADGVGIHHLAMKTRTLFTRA